MSRVLVAGARTKTADTAEQLVLRSFGAIAPPVTERDRRFVHELDCFLMTAMEYAINRDITIRKRDRLDARLDNPALRRHPKRLAAEQRYIDLVAAAKAWQWRVEWCCGQIGKRWKRLTPVQHRLAVEAGWPETEDAEVVMARVRRASEGIWPFEALGEVPEPPPF